MLEFNHVSDELMSSLAIPAGADKFKSWMEGFLNKVKAAHPEVYSDVVCDIYKMLHGEHFNEDMAKMAVAEMKNTDGSTGELISMKDAVSLAKQHGVVFDDNYNEYDFYYIVNMLYSDNYPLFKDNTATYAMMAKAWLSDPDVPSGKAWRYYKYVAHK